MNRALLQQALDALDGLEQNYGNLWQFSKTPEELDSLLNTLRAELEKPEPEPYAWVFVPHNELLWPDEVEHKTPCKATGYIPLYTKGT